MRDLFPRISQWHYLNYAGTGMLPISSVQLLKILSEEAAEPFFAHRDSWYEYQERARSSIAQLIGASTDEIAFTASTSGALSLVANAISWREGDRVLYPSDEFPSNRFVWENLVRKGVVAQAIEPQKGKSFAEQLSEMDLTGVRLVSFSLVSYWDGRVQDVKRVVEICKRIGSYVCVDAIQGLGAIPFDVREAGCDFVASGGQKWLCGPIGIGFLYVRKEIIEELFVPNVGWASVKNPRDFEAKSFEFDESARRFEAGGRDLWGIAALGCSIDALAAIGWDAIYGQVARHNRNIRQRVASLGYRPLCEEEALSGISALLLHSAESAGRLKEKCEEAKVVIVQRGRYVRISAHACTLNEDLEAFFSLLADA